MLLALCGFAAVTRAAPIEITLSGEFASFTNPGHPGNRIGYRFHEHSPLTWGDVPPNDLGTRRESPPSEPGRFNARPGVKIFHRRVAETNWIPQDWTFSLAPVADGLELLWVVETGDLGLPELYGVQQCFRLTGESNEAWRQKYARTAAFSEFDLWKATPAGRQPASLTWALRRGVWQRLPPSKETIGCRTRYGEALDARRSNGQLDLLGLIGPYAARMLWTSDSGLICRTSQDRKWAAGIYWERTTHLSDHHPADCLHAIVNIGGIPPHSQRTLRGKIYWLAGSGRTILKHWRKDFPDPH